MGELFKEFVNLFRGDETPLVKFGKLMAVLAVVIAATIALESAMGFVTIGRLERKQPALGANLAGWTWIW